MPTSFYGQIPLYKGAKKDNVLGRIASTFTALCEYGDFSATSKPTTDKTAAEEKSKETEKDKTTETKEKTIESSLSLDSLQYHINIVLPESRDQAVYDAIFKSLRDHLGGK